MDIKTQTRHSKFLGLVLRHRPEMIGLAPDEAGWVDTADLLAGLPKFHHGISAKELEEIVATSPKQRFAFNENKTRIRASQGHSIEVELGLGAIQPPEMLFHGTVAERIPAILREGLQKQQRHHVHLSADIETAKLVGGRRGKPVILEIRALEMHDFGQPFFRSANGVWLTDHVPPAFLREIDAGGGDL